MSHEQFSGFKRIVLEPSKAQFKSQLKSLPDNVQSAYEKMSFDAKKKISDLFDQPSNPELEKIFRDWEINYKKKMGFWNEEDVYKMSPEEKEMEMIMVLSRFFESTGFLYYIKINFPDPKDQKKKIKETMDLLWQNRLLPDSKKKYFKGDIFEKMEQDVKRYDKDVEEATETYEKWQEREGKKKRHSPFYTEAKSKLDELKSYDKTKYITEIKEVLKAFNNEKQMQNTLAYLLKYFGPDDFALLFLEKMEKEASYRMPARKEFISVINSAVDDWLKEHQHEGALDEGQDRSGKKSKNIDALLKNIKSRIISYLQSSKDPNYPKGFLTDAAKELELAFELVDRFSRKKT